MCCWSYQLLVKVTAPPSSKFWLQDMSAAMPNVEELRKVHMRKQHGHRAMQS